MYPPDKSTHTTIGLLYIPKSTAPLASVQPSYHTAHSQNFKYTSIEQFPSDSTSVGTRFTPTLTERQHQLSTQIINTNPQHQQHSTRKCLARRSTQRVLNTYLCPFILLQPQISAMLPPEAAPVDRPIRYNKGPNKQHCPHRLLAAVVVSSADWAFPHHHPHPHQSG